LLRRSGGNIGSTDFGPLTLECRAPVLIPRPETADVFQRLASLVREGMTRLGERRRTDGQAQGQEQGEARLDVRVLDLYTGSGAIALLLAHELRSSPRHAGRSAEWDREHEGNVRVLGVDINPLAIDLASLNREKTGLTREVEFVQGDALSPIDLDMLNGHPHLIVANPPYIPMDEYERLPASVKEWEDVDALLGDGERGQEVGDRVRADGLAHYRALARNLGGLLGVDGEVALLGLDDDWDDAGLPRVAVEVGDGQAGRVRRIMEYESRGVIGRTECWMDMYGKERIVVGWRR
jgi:release factor glutamine methyltransferase